jgi:polyphosphate glucokinase
MEILGIDIGGSGIKGAPVHLETGSLADERHRLPTPAPSTPEAVTTTVAELTRLFGWTGPIGCTFPAIIKQGVAYSAANVDPAWIGTNAEELIAAKTGCPVTVLNDADAAGLAEMEFGVGQGRSGVVILLTLGTGIGSAIFVNGQLLPNTEFGHMEIRGKEAEQRASDAVRKAKAWSWEKWTKRLNEFLSRMEQLFSPDLFILSGGVSKKHPEYLHLLKSQAEILPAKALNEAGIIGAALAAAKRGAFK